MRTSEITGVKQDDIMNGKNSLSKNARQIAMTLMVESDHMSPAEIAEFFGFYSRSPVQHAKAAVSQQPKLTQQLEDACRKIISEDLLVPVGDIYANQKNNELTDHKQH